MHSLFLFALSISFPSPNNRPAVWLVSVYRLDLRLCLIGHQNTFWVLQHAVLLLWWSLRCHFQDRTGLCFNGRIWSVRSGRPEASGMIFTTAKAFLSPSRSDTAWRGSSILINSIISYWGKSCPPLFPCHSTAASTTHSHVNHHPSSSPVTLKPIFWVPSIHKDSEAGFNTF